MRFKLFILMFCMILLVGSVSSFEIDNVKTFNETDRSLVVHNAFNIPLISEDIAKIIPLTPHELKVIRGKNRTVAEFKIENYADNYLNVFKGMEFYNLRNNFKSEEREFFFEYEIFIRTEEKPIYENICENLKTQNGTNYKNCSDVFLRNETINITEWKYLDISNPLSKGTYKIRIVTDVKPNEKIEFIPTWFGVRMPEYSEWTESLNIDIIGYWNFDQGAGLELPDVTGTNPNGTLENMNADNWTTGLLGNALIFDGGNDYIDTNFAPPWTSSQDVSACFWFNTNSSTVASKESFGSITASGDAFGMNWQTGMDWEWRWRDGDGNNDVVQETSASNGGTWKFHCFVRNTVSDRLLAYHNSVLEGNSSDTTTGDIDLSSLSIDFMRRNSGAPCCNQEGAMDEVGFWNRTLTQAEIDQLYNGGVGITFIGVFGPTITLNSPVDTFNTTNQTIDFNGTVVSEGVIDVANVSLIINNTYVETNSSGTNNTDYFFTSTLPDGNHNWTYESCNTDNVCLNATVRTFTIDSTNPSVIINFPNQTIPFHKKNTNLNFNWTVSDPNLDTCLYNYNSTNITVTCLDNTTQINITSGLINSLLFFVNDTLGNSNTTNVTLDYALFQENETFTSSILEGGVSTFTINLITNGTDITLGNLSYDSTENIGTIVQSSNNFTITKSITSPTVSVDTNKSFFWNITKSDGFNFALDPQNQTVLNFGVDNCSVNTDVLYNFTMVNEETESQFVGSTQNTTGRINLFIFNLLRTTEIQNFTALYNQTNPFAVCLSSDLSSGEKYVIDVEIKYDADGFAEEFYNIQNSTLDNSTLNQNITLYDLDDDDSQVFEITYKDETFLPVVDALIHIQRKYIDQGIFRVVEIPKTGNAGETVGHLVLNEVIYNFIIIKNGVILGSFNNKKAICQNPTINTCEINLNSFSSSIELKDFTQLDDFTFTLTFNETTRLIQSVFTTPSNTVSDIVLNVTKFDQLGNTTVCTQSLTTTSGTIQCTVPSSFGNETILAKITKDGVVQGQGFISLNQDPSDIFGSSLVFVLILLYLTLIGLAISNNPMITTISLLFAVILGVALNLVDSTGFIGAGATFLWIVVALIIVLIKGARRQ